ncbi:hypothetical protein LTR97_006631 [Elasticomyces elasticus]|uniref:Uncharacterized protein n=1 Tax=Elasticomyces elasticus TaxID=574655 RepID=A0AAN8A2M6_9PEZI|nr:hypothetical protein LTR97_006631 [Elasticomyces elasticus]
MEHSPLAKLPAELRNRIYAFVLSPRGVDAGVWEPITPISNPLTHVCRQIRQETLSMDCATIHLWSDDHYFRDLHIKHIEGWMRSVGPQACSHVRDWDNCISSVAYLKERNPAAAEAVLAATCSSKAKETTIVKPDEEGFQVHGLDFLPECFWEPYSRIQAIVETLAHMGVSMCAVKAAQKNWKLEDWLVVSIPCSTVDVNRRDRTVAMVDGQMTTWCDGCEMHTGTRFHRDCRIPDVTLDESEESLHAAAWRWQMNQGGWGSDAE